MKRNFVETALGALVIAVAATFLVFSINTAQVGQVSGYELNARFSGIGGLGVGDNVLISGVKVGSVVAVALDPETFLANVKMSIDNHVKVPTDTAALIRSESLLGGRYIQLEPGADEEVMEPGAVIQFTQAPQNLEQLLGQFIFSMSDDKKGDDKAGDDKAKVKNTAAPVAAAPLDTTDAHDNP
ncbi:MAG TPA: outer membrane lipid asymmetry maintenance protein MlaD [Micavibrio sp.]